MASYRISWKRSAQKELRKLPQQEIQRILQAVEALADEPYPSGVRKLVGSEQSYRIRIGDYRVVYTIAAAKLIIEIVRVRHRKDVYVK